MQSYHFITYTWVIKTFHKNKCSIQDQNNFNLHLFFIPQRNPITLLANFSFVYPIYWGDKIQAQIPSARRFRPTLWSNRRCQYIPTHVCGRRNTIVRSNNMFGRNKMVFRKDVMRRSKIVRGNSTVERNNMLCRNNTMGRNNLTCREKVILTWTI